MTMEIENDGDGLLEFEITSVEDSQGVSKNIHWLQISPLRGVVKAQEKK